MTNLNLIQVVSFVGDGEFFEKLYLLADFVAQSSSSAPGVTRDTSGVFLEALL